jgi:hypothetical protein
MRANKEPANTPSFLIILTSLNTCDKRTRLPRQPADSQSYNAKSTLTLQIKKTTTSPLTLTAHHATKLISKSRSARKWSQQPSRESSEIIIRRSQEKQRNSLQMLAVMVPPGLFQYAAPEWRWRSQGAGTCLQNGQECKMSAWVSRGYHRVIVGLKQKYYHIMMQISIQKCTEESLWLLVVLRQWQRTAEAVLGIGRGRERGLRPCEWARRFVPHGGGTRRRGQIPGRESKCQIETTKTFITFLSPLRGSPSSTVASRVTPQSYFLL